MITPKELNDNLQPLRSARNLTKRPMRFMSRGALSPIQEMSVQDTAPRQMNFAGFGETAATAAVVSTGEPVKPTVPAWAKWAGIAAAAGIAYWFFKKRK